MDPSSTEFRLARHGTEGYDPVEVDAFVARVLQALRHDPPTMAPWEVRDQVFTISRVHRGYDEHEVDDFLDRAEAELRAAHGQQLDVAPVGAPVATTRWWIVSAVCVLVVVASLMAWWLR